MSTQSGQSGEFRPGSTDALRILLVDQEELCEPLRRMIGDGAVEHVPTYLAAMGELGGRAADVVIGPIGAMANLIEATAHGLRRLAPTAELIVVAEPGQESEAAAAIEAGFDRTVVRPVDPGQLAAVIGARFARSAASPLEMIDADPSEDAPHREAAGDLGDLGDVDLVEAVLAGRGQLRALVQRLVGARSGVVGVALAPEDEPAPAGYAACDVMHEGRRLGVLHAPPPARAHDLERWATWVGTWLALDDQHERLKSMAMRDELTGIWNRRYFNRFLGRILDRAAEDRSQVTLMVFDIDDFKRYNDQYGHSAGDEILCEAAQLMSVAVRGHDVVARIGGDEFAVIFWDAEAPRKPHSTHPHDVANAARRFQKAICEHRFPKLADKAPGTLTISGGLASYPWDGRSPEELLEQADAMALRSKQQGKNAITFGPGALSQQTGGEDGAE